VVVNVSFTLKCNVCGSEECRIDAVDNGEFIEISAVCDDCGHED
jgi:hypothetical protein